jgi:hypothetical protein
LVALFGATISGVALAASVEPVLFDPWQSGNAGSECDAVGDYAYGYKIDNWDAFVDGDFEASFDDGEDNTLTVDNNDGQTFDWSATNPIGAVIVKGGTQANVYYYDPQQSSDTGLVAPTNPNNGIPFDISHATFCWNPQDAMCFGHETGWGEGLRYVKKGNWAMYTLYDGSQECVDLIAGQTMVAGEVCFDAPSGGSVDITIELDDGWFFAFQDNFGNWIQNLHIQGYDAPPPSKNPAPGKFQHKFVAQGQSWSWSLPEAGYAYGVHVALMHQVDCDQ